MMVQFSRGAAVPRNQACRSLRAPYCVRKLCQRPVVRLCILMSLSPCVHACISCGGLNAPTTEWLKSFGMASCGSNSDVHFVSGVHASVVTVHNLPSVSAACSTVLYKRVYRVVDS